MLCIITATLDHYHIFFAIINIAKIVKMYITHHVGVNCNANSQTYNVPQSSSPPKVTGDRKNGNCVPYSPPKSLEAVQKILEAP